MKKLRTLYFNEHRNEYEVWEESEVIARGTDLDKLLARYPELALREK